MAKTPGSKKIDAILADLDAPRRRIATALRAAIRAEAPQLAEDVKWNSPVWGGRKPAILLMVYDDHVNLGFFRGAELAEKHPAIVGTGKSLRHIKIPDAAGAALASVRAAIRDAVRLDASDP